MRKRLVSLAFAFTVVVFSGHAFAGTPVLSLLPSSQTINPGLLEQATVDLVISDLNGTLLGAFDVDISFDASVLSLDSLTFGPFLGDLGLGEAIGGVALGLGSGEIDSFEVSLLAAAALSALQAPEGGSFVLATLVFDGVGVGTSALGIGDVVLSDDFGIALPDPTKVDAEVRVVPLPAAIWMFAGALGGLFAWGRRNRVV